MEKEFDVLIVGSGPAGYAAARILGAAGKRVVIFEKEKVGGTCLNVGCIPTKYFLGKAEQIAHIRQFALEGVIDSAGSFNFSKIQAGQYAVIETLKKGIKGLLHACKVELISGNAVVVSNNTIKCKDSYYKGKHIIIATGSVPRRIDFPGSEYALDSSYFFEMQTLPRSVVIVGGGVIGLELADILNSFGSEVSVVEVADSLLPWEYPNAVKVLHEELCKKGIKIYTSSKVVEAQEKEGQYQVTIANENHQNVIHAEKIFMCVGRIPNTAQIDCDHLGIEKNADGSIKTDQNLRTSQSNIFAIGDVIGGYQLAHAAYHEAEVVSKNILGIKEAVNEEYMPKCVYTSPNFASIGVHSGNAHQAVHVSAYPYQSNGMALSSNASGILYVFSSEESNQVVGVTIVGQNAAELISLASLSISQGIEPNDWMKTIIPHPSFGEMIKEGILASSGNAIHVLQKSKREKK